MQRFLALGDSYTIGESVVERDRWPNQVSGLLRDSGVADFAPPEIIAQTGWTTDELAAAIAERQPKGPYHLVTLLIGVNNQYRGRPLDEYREQFAELLQTAIGLAGGNRQRVLVLSIPDWGVTPFAEGRDRRQVAREIDGFNLVNLEEADRQGAVYIDVTAISRRAASEPALIAEDGLHPSGEMYRLWAEEVLTFAAAALRS